MLSLPEACPATLVSEAPVLEDLTKNCSPATLSQDHRAPLKSQQLLLLSFQTYAMTHASFFPSPMLFVLMKTMTRLKEKLLVSGALATLGFLLFLLPGGCVLFRSTLRKFCSSSPPATEEGR